MSDRIVPNIICFQTQNNTLNNIGALLKGVLIDSRARNFVHTRILRARCVHARHRARNLSSPGRQISRLILAEFKRINELLTPLKLSENL